MRDIQSNDRQASRVQVATEMAIDGLSFRARALVLIARVPIVHHEFVAITKRRSRISRSKGGHLGRLGLRDRSLDLERIHWMSL